ncbi:MAG TPA: EscU/YscU/HrcU family type III secretion system export apparatus switch protein [Miltoncostaeaceae bacterium]|nr:EscU/YscU/HrcU family type III secretion system export apparatus switch protein [Miltoncostaeaceae bacterium]
MPARRRPHPSRRLPADAAARRPHRGGPRAARPRRRGGRRGRRARDARGVPAPHGRARTAGGGGRRLPRGRGRRGAHERPGRPRLPRVPCGRDHAPRVAATGGGSVADRIVDAARAHGVPVREDPSLAEALAGLELWQHVPPELYAVIAEVFAWAYRADRDYARSRP